MKAHSTSSTPSGKSFTNIKFFVGLLFTVLLLLPAGLRAQELITVGSGTVQTYQAPVNNYYNYSFVQMLYNSSEVPAGQITSIGFQYYYSSSSSKSNVKIYVGTTQLTSFSSTSDYVPLSNMTLVYTGNMNCSQGWNTFNFSTPYFYSGNGSLVVYIEDMSGSYSGSSYKFYATSCSNKVLTYYSDTYSPSNGTPGSMASSALPSERPNTRFAIRPPCSVLNYPADGATVNSSSVTLSWDAVSNVTGYHVYLSEIPTKPANYSYSTTGTTQTVSNLTYGLHYCWITPYTGSTEMSTCNQYSTFARSCPGTIATPTITADADLNNLSCGQTVTLTADGPFANYFWYSDPACTHQVGVGSTYTFSATDHSQTYYCKSGCVSSAGTNVIRNFSYTGGVQSFTVPSGAASVNLEVWGAQGGYRSSSTYGGKGGYAAGTLPTNGGEILYVYVGGSGNTGGTSGGYNGGGSRSTYVGGGGATDIRIGGTSLYNRVIVAGGGGSDGASNKQGMYGGGETGGSSTQSFGSGGQGGTQTAGGSGGSGYSGSFGQGGQGVSSSGGYGGGGGGGWYGGGGSYPDGSGDDDRGGGGGSGYVWTSNAAQVSGYLVSSDYFMSATSLIAGDEAMPDPNGGTMTGREGNGYARISYTEPPTYSYSSPASISASPAAVPPTPEISIDGACENSTVVMTVTNAQPGITYGWWPNSNSSCTGAPEHEGTSYTVFGISSNTNYYVRAYSGSYGEAGCSSPITDVEIVIGNAPSFSITSTSETSCNGSAVTFNITDNNNDINRYVWSDDIITYTHTRTVYPTITTTYTVTAYNDYCSTVQSKTITVNAPQVGLLSSENGCIAVGDEVNLSVTSGITADVYVGSNSGNTGYLPLYSCYNYASSEQIYTPAEIGQAGWITAISYYVTSFTANRSSISVYMKNTAKSSFSSASDRVLMTSADLVASGVVMPSTSSTGWQTITLSQPFYYDGTSNLLIGLHSSYLSYNCTNNFATYSTGEYRALYAYSDSYSSYLTESSTSASMGYMASNNYMRLEMSEAYNYAWSNGETDDHITVSPTESTTYHVTVSSNEYPCSAVLTHEVHVTPDVQVTPENPMACSGGTVTLTATGADNYTWRRGPNVTSTVVSTSANYDAPVGTYYITGQNNDGCSTTESVTVNSLAAPNAGAIADGTFCQSDYEITLESESAATSGGNVEYRWVIGSLTTPWSADYANYTLTAEDRTAIATGTFNVTRQFRDACGNTGSTPAVQVAINPPMDAPTVTGNLNLICGQNTTLTASSTYSSEYLHYRWYSDPQGQNLVYEGRDFTTPAISENTTYYLQISDEHLLDGIPQEYSTQGSYVYTIPADAYQVKLEVWGAQGGYRSSSAYGGKGGYSVGTWRNFTPGQNIYVVVGGSGNSGTSSSSIYAGGYNGGGYRYLYNGGGGATHMATRTGLLKDLVSYQNDVLIVAGGGGSDGGSSYAGAPGGGLVGGTASGGFSSGSYCGYGGTQEYSGYSSSYTSTTQYTTGLSTSTLSYSYGGFGFGGAGTYYSSGYGGAGGGGWYGGSGTIPDGSADDDRGGGGGSGHINPSLQDAQTIAGSSTFSGPNGIAEVGHSGNGYARITPSYFIQDHCPSVLVPVNITVNQMDAPTVEVRSACIGQPSELAITNPMDGYVYVWSSDPSFVNIEHTGTTFNPTVTAETTYYVRAERLVGTSGSVDFNYTGSTVEYEVPFGISSIRLEVWGAQGGDYEGYLNSYRHSVGGYSVGTLQVNAGDRLFINVGGAGTYAYGSLAAGGFNGGGQAYSANRYTNSGGGATDIRIGSNSLYSRVIVAGGGGGSRDAGSQGNLVQGASAGGGIEGIGGSTYESATLGTGRGGRGGGATAPGVTGNVDNGETLYAATFGAGGYTSASSSYGVGGGGGWYGGGAGSADANGGGGSGYVYTAATASQYPSGCLLNSRNYLTDAQTIAGNQTFLSPTGVNEVGHAGNGFARITTVDVISNACPSEYATVTLTPHTSPTFTLTSSANSYCAGGDAVTLTVENPSSNITSYTWSDGTSNAETTHAVRPGHTTTYTVSASTGNCWVADSVTITVNAPDVEMIVSQTGCINPGDQVSLEAVDLTPFGSAQSINQTNGSTVIVPGYEYTFYDDGGPSGSYSNGQDYTHIFSSQDGSPIEIVFSQMAGESCCDNLYLYDGSSTSSSALYSGNMPSVSLNTTYTANSGYLTVRSTSDGSVTYDGWVATIRCGSPTTYAWNTGEATSTITVNPETTTTYTVTVTNSQFSCPAVYDYTVNVNPTVEISATAMNVCQGSTTTLTATGANSYYWNTASTADVITVAPDVSTTYVVSATSSNGCSATADINIGVTTAQNATAGELAGSDAACLSDFFFTIPSAQDGIGGGVVQYQWTCGGNTYLSNEPTYTLTHAELVDLGVGSHTFYRYFKDECFFTDWTQSVGSYTLTLNGAMSTPTVSAPSTVLCGESAELTATVSSNSQHLRYLWYSDPGAQNLVYEGRDFTTPALTENTTYYLQVRDEYTQEGTPVVFSTVGSHTYPLPANAAQLKLEVWGAQGGTYSSYPGGLGGYSMGTLTNLSGLNNLYVNIGGAGSSNGTDGGYNGGGAGVSNGRGGGGATDIRTVADNLYSRIIVAGGGGGAGVGANTYPAGCGGGLYGGDGYYNYTNGSYVIGNYRTGGGATPTQGGISWNSISGTEGTFGDGGTASTYSCGGGGGGWYGGGGAYDNDSDADGKYGGGGSGYVWCSEFAQYAPAGYLLSEDYYMTNAATYAGNGSIPAPGGGTEVGHTGDGYARITPFFFVRNSCPSDMVSVTINVQQMPAPIVEVRSACIGEPSELVVANAMDGYTYVWSTDPDFSTIEHTGASFTPTVTDTTKYYVRGQVLLEPISNFEYTGQSASYIVPMGVSSIQVELWGANGGDVAYSGNPWQGGKGGYTVATMNVSAGQTLNVNVGGRGQDGSSSVTGTAIGGYNGGGNSGTNSNSSYFYGGAGGGASDIRLNGTTLYDRILVAGGGGGAAYGPTSSPYLSGGDGGGISGTSGYANSSYTTRVGSGGTQNAGGAAGTYSSEAYSGVIGNGGAGGNGDAGGGGGGGGYYGGGGGNYGSQMAGSGGGGSGYIASGYAGNTMTYGEAPANPDHAGNGFIRISLLEYSDNACPSEVATVELIPQEAPTFTLSASSNTYCSSTVDSVALNIQNPSSNIISYTWSDGTTTTDNTHAVRPGHTTTYTVSATTGNCWVADSVTITVNAPDVEMIVSQTGCINLGDEVSLEAVDVTSNTCSQSINQSNGSTVIVPGCEYTFYDDGGPSGSYSNNQDYTHIFSSQDGSPIEITFSQMNAEGCCDYLYLYNGSSTSSSALYSNYMYNLPLNTTYTANSGYLTVRSTSDGSVTYAGWVATIRCASPITYAWNTGETTSTITVNPETTTTYTVTVTNPQFSCPAVYDYTVKVNPTVAITSEPESLCNVDGDAILTASGAQSYIWNNGTMGSVRNVMGVGTYMVTATSADGCAVSAEYDLIAPVYSAGQIAGTTREICQSELTPISIHSISDGATGGDLHYRWLRNGTVISNSDVNEYTIYVTELASLVVPNTYVYTREVQNGCTGTWSASEGSVTLTINSPMPAPAVYYNNHVYCGTDGTLRITYPDEGKMYYWYEDAECTQLYAVGSEVVIPNMTETDTLWMVASETHLEQHAYQFTYTGGVQEFVIPEGTTSLTLQAWGAQGGGQGGYGGPGAYATGTLTNFEGIEKLYVYVGGTGTYASGTTGWNGGGNVNSFGGSGGGATDFSLRGTNGSTSWNSADHINTRLLVAGGGGGEGYNYTTGGYAGGTGTAGDGGAGTATGGYGASMAAPGSYNTAGLFGYASQSNSSNGGGGGGGWYGGGSGVGAGTDSGGGGGSSYAWSMNYASWAPSAYRDAVSTDYYLSNVSLLGGNEYMPTIAGGQEYGHSGNGCAQIIATQYTSLGCPSLPVAYVINVDAPSAPVVFAPNGICGMPVTMEVEDPIAGYTYLWSTHSDFSDTVNIGTEYMVNSTTDTLTYYVKSYVPGISSTTVDFNYTGSVQQFTVPNGVTSLNLEVWGAQGGEGCHYSGTGSDVSGGRGGYSSGTLEVVPGQVLYVYVGQQGLHNAGSLTAWNGGGAQGVSTFEAGTGGGATDIRVSGNALINRVIVAGGGGGGGNESIGGAGGGYSGIQPASSTQYSSRIAGIGGTQYTGYQLGIGEGLNGQNLNGGGGGGYYGGGQGDNSTGGGGGSGYIGGVTNGNTIAGNLAITEPDGTIAVGHGGNGFARISYQGRGENLCESSTATVTLIINDIPTPTFVQNEITVDCADEVIAELTDIHDVLYVWYSDSTCTNVISDGAVEYDLGMVTESTTLYVRAYTLDDFDQPICSSAVAAVKINVIPLTRPVFNPSEITPSCGVPISLILDSVVQDYTYIWYADSTLTRAIDSRSSTIMNIDGRHNITDTSYYVVGYRGEISGGYVCSTEPAKVTIHPIAITMPDFATSVDETGNDMYDICDGDIIYLMGSTSAASDDDDTEDPLMVWYDENHDYVGVSNSYELFTLTPDMYHNSTTYTYFAHAATDVISLAGSFNLNSPTIHFNGDPVNANDVFFDVEAEVDLTIDTISFYAASDGSAETMIYVRRGSFADAGATETESMWMLNTRQTGMTNHGGLCKIALSAPLVLQAGESYGFYIWTSNQLQTTPYGGGYTQGISTGSTIAEGNVVSIKAGKSGGSGWDAFNHAGLSNWMFMGSMGYHVDGETRFGCLSTESIELYFAVHEAPTIPQRIDAVDVACQGDGIQLTAWGGTLGDNSLFTWSADSCENNSFYSTATSSSVNIVAGQTETYFVKLTDEYCPSTECVSKTVHVVSSVIVDSITAPAYICATGSLNVATPSYVVNNGEDYAYALTGRGWQCSQDGTNWIEFTDSTNIGTQYNGWYARYYVEIENCKTGYSNEITLAVDSLPVIAHLAQPDPFCSAHIFNWDSLAPAVTMNNNSGSATEEGWNYTINGQEVAFDPTRTFTFEDDVKAWYLATNACGTVSTDTINMAFIQPPTVENITALEGAVCAGLPLALVPPTVHTFGGNIYQGWEYASGYGSTSYTPLPADTIISYDMTESVVRYYIGNECSATPSTSNPVQIFINEVPKVDDLLSPVDTYCSGATFDIVAPSVLDDGGIPETGYGWYLSQDSSFVSTSELIAVNVADGIDADLWDGMWLRYADSNACGAGFSNAVQVAVYPSFHLTVTPAEQDACLGNTFHFAATIDHPDSNIVTYRWDGNGLLNTMGSQASATPNALGQQQYVVTARESNHNCTATAVATLNMFLITKDTNVHICASDLDYVFDAVNHPDEVCTQSGRYTYRYTTASGCDSLVNLNLTVTYPIERPTRLHYCNYSQAYVWPATGEVLGGPTVKDTVITREYIIPCANDMSDVDGHLCDSIIYSLIFEIANEPYLDVPVTDITLPVNQPATANFSVRKDCDFPGAKMAISYNFYKDNQLIDVIQDYGQVYVSTHTPIVDESFGHSVYIGSGEVPGNTYSMYNYDFDYFFANYFCSVDNQVTASWNQPGEYRMEMVVIRKATDAGMNYAFQTDEHELMGGAGGISTDSIFSDTVNIYFHVGSVDTLPTQNIVVCAAELPYYVGSLEINESGYYEAFTGNEGNFQLQPVNVTVQTPVINEFDVTLNNSCSSYVWNGVPYASQGTYYDTIRYVESGCDSLISILNLYYGSGDVVIDTTVVACGSFTWNETGETYTESKDTTVYGTYGACDAQYNLHLTVNEIYVADQNIVIAATQLPYQYDADHQFDAAGTYPIVYTRANGCDSIINLTISAENVIIDIDTNLFADDVPAANQFDITINAGSLDNRKVIVEYEITRNGEIIDNMSEFGYVYMSTEYPDMHRAFGREVYNGLGNIPANTFNVINYDYRYFYLDFLQATTSHLVANWNMAGDYKVKFTVRECEGGLDYVLRSNLTGNIIGGGGSVTTTNILAVDSVIMHYEVDTVFVRDSIVICSNELPYVFHDLVLTESTTENLRVEFTDRYHVYDTVSTFSLTVHPAYYIYDTAYLCVGQPYVDNNFDLSADTIRQMTRNGKAVFTMNPGTVMGCDSLVSLTLFPMDLPNTRVAANAHRVCANSELPVYFYANGAEQYTWTPDSLMQQHSDTVNMFVPSSMYVYLTGTNGYATPTDSIYCSKTDSTYITVMPQAGTTEYYAEVCQGQPYDDELFHISIDSTSYPHVIEKTILTDTGFCGGYYAHLTLTVNPIYNSRYGYLEVSDEVCEGHEYHGNGFDLTVEEIEAQRHISATNVANDIVFYHEGVTAHGCDSITRLSLHINLTHYGQGSVHFCTPASWPYTYTENGQNFEVYGDTTVAVAYTQVVNGCDSVHYTTIYFDPMPQINILNNEVCANINETDLEVVVTDVVADSIKWFSGTEVMGTDYILNVNSNDFINDWSISVYAGTCVKTEAVTINTIDLVEVPIDSAICQGESYVSPDGTYTETGIYQWYVPTNNGCDLLYVLNLTVNPTYTVTASREIRTAELPYTWNGVVFEEAGTLPAYLTTVNGCDSIVNMTLTLIDTLSGQPFMLVAPASDNSFTLTTYANSEDLNKKVSVNYTLYKKNTDNQWVAVQSVQDECGGALNIATSLNGAYVGRNAEEGTGNIPANTFAVGVTFYDYFYFYFLNTRENLITHNFTVPGEYQVVFDLVEETNGVDYNVTYTDHGVTRLIGGKNSVEGASLAAPVAYTFSVAAPQGGGDNEQGVATLIPSTSSVTTAASTVTLDCEATGFDANTKVAIDYTIYRDDVPVSVLSNVARIEMSTWMPSSASFVGTYIGASTGSIPGNTFRPISSFTYNYFYMNFLTHATNRISANWLQTGHYTIEFKLVTMEAGTDIALSWNGTDRIGGKNAESTGTVLDTKTIDYNITTVSAAPTGITDMDEDGWSIYPNPARDRVDVYFPNMNAQSDITVTDMNGKIVATVANDGTQHAAINVSTWAAGVYFVNVRTNDTVVTKKLVVTK